MATKERFQPIVDGCCEVLFRNHPWQVKELQFYNVLYSTPNTLRVKVGGVTVTKMHHLVHCLPDDGAWETAQRLHERFREALEALAEGLRSLGTYAAKFEAEGGLKAAANPLCETVVTVHTPPDATYSTSVGYEPWHIPTIRFEKCSRHTAKMLDCEEGKVFQDRAFECSEEAWQKIRLLRQAAEEASEEERSFFDSLGTYANALSDGRYGVENREDAEEAAGSEVLEPDEQGEIQTAIELGEQPEISTSTWTPKPGDTVRVTGPSCLEMDIANPGWLNSVGKVAQLLEVSGSVVAAVCLDAEEFGGVWFPFSSLEPSLEPGSNGLGEAQEDAAAGDEDEKAQESDQGQTGEEEAAVAVETLKTQGDPQPLRPSEGHQEPELNWPGQRSGCIETAAEIWIADRTEPHSIDGPFTAWRTFPEGVRLGASDDDDDADGVVYPYSRVLSVESSGADDNDETPRPASPAVSAVEVEVEVEVLEVPPPMTSAEARQTVEQIRQHLESARELLYSLHLREGWRALGYSSWRECAKAEFGRSQAQVYRLLDAARVEVNIGSPIGELPEWQTRELKRVPPERQREVYEEAQRVASTSGGRVTGAVITEAANRLLAPEPEPEEDTPVEEPQASEITAGDLDQAEGKLATDSTEKAIEDSQVQSATEEPSFAELEASVEAVIKARIEMAQPFAAGDRVKILRVDRDYQGFGTVIPGWTAVACDGWVEVWVDKSKDVRRLQGDELQKVEPLTPMSGNTTETTQAVAMPGGDAGHREAVTEVEQTRKMIDAARHFQEGDRVRIVSGPHVGRTGTVEIENDTWDPVAFKGSVPVRFGKTSHWFKPGELELVERHQKGGGEPLSSVAGPGEQSLVPVPESTADQLAGLRRRVADLEAANAYLWLSRKQVVEALRDYSSQHVNTASKSSNGKTCWCSICTGRNVEGLLQAYTSEYDHFERTMGTPPA